VDADAEVFAMAVALGPLALFEFGVAFHRQPPAGPGMSSTRLA
jgi:hypothetical protein